MARMMFIFLSFSLFTYACKSDSSSQNNHSEKDSILTKYFSIVDTLPYYDTTTFDYKLLKAHSSNDTNTLKEMVRRFQELNANDDWRVYFDSCVRQQEFNDIIADEKYRFIYSAAFCPYATSTTIVRSGDKIVLSAVVYQYAWDTLQCRVIEQTTVIIDNLKWESFLESLEFADFWGLKEDNGNHGTDGSTLEVYGFKRGKNNEWNPDKLSFISRWSPQNNSILYSFIRLIKYSKIKKGCIGVP